MSTATAAVVHEPGGPFTLTEVELGPLRPDEVRVRTVATGVCHTDLSAASGATPFPLPGVLGHEGAGVVEEVGAQVGRAAVGDRVLMSFTSCGRCRRCRQGHPAYCRDHLSLNLLGGRRADGTTPVTVRGRELNAHFFGQSSFATRVVADERGLVVLPPGTTDEDLVVLAPLGCGLMTGAGAVLNELRPRPDDVLAITGAGAVGLAAVMAARATSVARVVVVDRLPSRLDLALELGATDVVDTTAVDLEDALEELTQGRGVDAAVETTGVVPVLDALVASLAVRGRCAVVGAPPAGARGSFDVQALLPGRSIRGVTLGDAEAESFVPALLGLHRQGRFPLERLQVTYPFADIGRAVADAARGDTVKPVLVFG